MRQFYQEFLRHGIGTEIFQIEEGRRISSGILRTGRPAYEITPSLTAQMPRSNNRRMNDKMAQEKKIGESKEYLSVMCEGDQGGEGDGGLIGECDNDHKNVSLLFQKTGMDQTSFINIFMSLGFTHHTILMEKCPDLVERCFYMGEAVVNQWSSRMLSHQIDSSLFSRKGKLPNNFKKSLPSTISEQAIDVFREEYLLEFLNTDVHRTEPSLEKEILRKLKQFMMSLGRDFAFMGNQYRIIVGGEEFFIDLLFYHRKMRCMVGFELKTGKFRPEYVGKMNFYITALDELVRHPEENPSIGIILCKQKNETVVEYAFGGFSKPMGIATYRDGKNDLGDWKKYLPKEEQLIDALN